jgi:2-dehydropantoate 2-reductase
VFCAQNGVAGERLALRRFRHVSGMFVWLPAAHLQPGAVEAQGTPRTGLLPVGRYPHGTDQTAERVAADLAGSTFLAPVRADVMRWKYGKLLINLANAVEAVCGPGAARSEHAAQAPDLRRRAQQEGAAVLAAAGIGYAGLEEISGQRGDQVRVEPVNGARRSGGSSWQSLTRGTGSIEADYLNGEIVLLGRMHGVPTPVNELLQRLANQFAASRRAPGSITPGEMAALVAGLGCGRYITSRSWRSRPRRRIPSSTRTRSGWTPAPATCPGSPGSRDAGRREPWTGRGA